MSSLLSGEHHHGNGNGAAFLAAQMLKHDSHYREIEKLGVEPVKVMESRVLTGIPSELHETVLRSFRISQAINYLMRAGTKGDPIQEIEKAENWLHRAKTGAWKTEQITPEQDLEFRKDVEEMFGGDHISAEISIEKTEGNYKTVSRKRLHGFRYKRGFFFEDKESP